ncbi:MAG: hypothetical protein FWD18_01915 [Micrococcales bacterium]|nr:hypothetical protein [Micrococcales bacterium]
MPSPHPLGAGRGNSVPPLARAGLLEDGESLVAAINSGTWVEGGLAAFSFEVSTASAAAPPLDLLAEVGLGWVADHLSPLSDWLDDLTGDAEQVRAFSTTWATTAQHLSVAAQELTRAVGADLVDTAGETAEAYRTFAADVATHIEAVAAWAEGISTGLQMAGTIVQVVHDLVRDTLTEVVESILSWASGQATTGGLGTPRVLVHVTAQVAAASVEIGPTVTRLLTSLRELGRLLDRLEALLRRAKALFDEVLDVNRQTSHGVTTAPQHTEPPAGSTPLGPRRLPDVSDLPHPHDGGDLGAWAGAVAARHGSLTPDEVTSLYRFTTTGHGDAGPLPGDARASSAAARVQADVDRAVSGLESLAPAAQPTVRGVDLPQHVLNGVRLGQQFPDPAYLSPATAPPVTDGGGGSARLRIDGRSGVDVSVLSHYRTGAEVLFSSSAYLEVVGRHWNPSDRCWDIDLRERS